MKRSWGASVVILFFTLSAAQWIYSQENKAGSLRLATNDVIAVLGGEDTVAWQDYGYVETLLAQRLAQVPLPRFRYLCWEGDTVYSQPRDLNFPSWPDQLRRVKASVVVCQFGQAESLDETRDVAAFRGAYEKLLDSMREPGRSFVLVSPTPFERPSGSLPDRSAKNERLRQYVDATRDLASRRGTLFIDLYSALKSSPPSNERLTRDGLHLNEKGQWRVAQAFVVGLGVPSQLSGEVGISGTGSLKPAAVEGLRQRILAKNRLWFDYWRPQNWAFLNGDRIDQPSSHDHTNPKVRWFPSEMEQFVPLIMKAEVRIDEVASGLQSNTTTR